MMTEWCPHGWERCCGVSTCLGSAEIAECLWLSLSAEHGLSSA